MKIVTWNVNSVRARHDRLVAFLKRHAPDVLCLQELKVTDENFPYDAVRMAGYHTAVHGQKTYNGVAILSRKAPTEIDRGMGDSEADTHARLISAKIDGVRVYSAYFPNGERVGSDKWKYKLRWIERLRAHLDAKRTPDEPLALCGDFNVAPDDKDVAEPDAWADAVLCHPAVREALEKVRAFGFTDVFREKHPAGGIYSWWDYRALGFVKNNGLRIDHVFATAALAARCTEAAVDREERKGDAPSDHAPVLATFR